MKQKTTPRARREETKMVPEWISNKPANHTTFHQMSSMWDQGMDSSVVGNVPEGTDDST